jgi:hypothetical protein
MLEIEQAFNTTGNSVYDFYQRPGIGLYIPLYQREYSWDKDNIEQLLDDISRGIERLTEDGSDDEIRFLGTIISVTEKNHKKIEPVDLRGLPTAIEKLIDGQQRLSTICLFASQLHRIIDEIYGKISSKSEIKEEINEITSSWKDKLVDVFSLDLKRGTPSRKPQIIRGHDDKWIKDGEIEDAYKSDLANYLARYIDFVFVPNSELPKPNLKSNVGKNTRQIYNWLDKAVSQAHENKSDEFASAQKILSNIQEEYIWQYERPHLTELVNSFDASDKKSDGYLLSSLVQIFAVTHYLLDRCCFTLIQPLNDDWAFDMFQSLNASGTPLTAIETFKPLVVNTSNITYPNKPFKGSISDLSFEKIDNLFKQSSSAAQKSKLTNDFLTSVAIVVEGYKLTSHFSHQRKWLDKIYEDFQTFDKKEKYIKFIGNYASFFKDVWIEYDGQDNQVLSTISSNQEAELASIILMYLKQSNHKMASTILGAFYNSILEGEDSSIQNFIDACKAIGAFYTIWRSAQSNSGLDSVYRTYFKGEKDIIDPKNFKVNQLFDAIELKEYLRNILDNQGLLDKEKWLLKASKELNYKSSKSISGFILMLTSHDTISDHSNPGLMKIGTVGVASYLNVEKWKSKGVTTIEHIAPQTPDSSWDVNLYDENELFQCIGNLTLLPTEVNISAGNKGWKEKLIYYRHLSEQDPDKLMELEAKAIAENIQLNPETIILLQNAKYNDHIKSLVTVGENGVWDAELVQKRTQRMLEISFDRLFEWLQ